MLNDKENNVVTINTTNFSIEKTMPLKDSRRLDLYINHIEWTMLVLLNCTCLEFQSRLNDEYFYLTFKLRQRAPPPDFSNLLEISHHDEKQQQKKKITKQQCIAFKDISRRHNNCNQQHSNLASRIRRHLLSLWRLTRPLPVGKGP